MTPRFYCSEPAEEQLFDQDKRPLKAEDDLILPRIIHNQEFHTEYPRSPFSSDPIGECDLFWYPELR